MSELVYQPFCTRSIHITTHRDGQCTNSFVYENGNRSTNDLIGELLSVT